MTRHKEYTLETYNDNEGFKVEPRYGKGTRDAFKFRDHKHTPYNKRPGSVNSSAYLIIEDEPEGANTDDKTKTTAPVKGWLSISIEEVTTHGDRSQSRTISVTLSHDARKALLAYLLATEA